MAKHFPRALNTIKKSPSSSISYTWFRRAHARATLTVVKRAMAFTFIHTDHLGTARMVTDMHPTRASNTMKKWPSPGISFAWLRRDGNVVSMHDFNAFGEERTEELLAQNSHKFTGHERDAETGLDYMMARMYSSNVPRFLQTDPGYDYNYADPMSWNLYSYVRNNPINGTDPTGMFKRIRS
ncbi:MAG: RHS repeat-associated core domain-containing protein [Rhodopseudomonas palustris]|nr:RHS repeat-associated core domain-containing protein [Rhodopseudomonas palustris]